MSVPDERNAELLEQYLTQLESNPHAQPPPGLDPQMIETAIAINARLAAQGPKPEFVASLREQLDREAAALARASSKEQKPRGGLSLSRWSFAGIAAALLLAVIALVVYATRPPSVSAQELLDDARSAAGDLNGVGIKSFEMTQTNSNNIADDPQTSSTRETIREIKTWYAGPTLWRIESQSEMPNQAQSKTITVSDGAAQWDHNVNDKTVVVQAADPRNFPSPSVLSLDLLQQDMSNCYDPKVIGEEPIAGRAAYKVYLGPAKCRSAAAPELNGPHTIWLDKETFFVLKSEIRAVNSDLITSALEVTHIVYNADLADDLFQFSPPADAHVNDLRPKPAPSAREFQSQLTALAARADFPIFVPLALPNDLVPRAPQYNAIENHVELAFVPAAQAAKDTPADLHGVSILQKRADYELVRNWTDGAEPLDLNGSQAWVRRGNFDTNAGTGSNSAVLMLKDGTLVSISSFSVPPDQLIESAKSLKPVPGGHAPLPNPTAPTLAEIRALADFPFAVPTYVPEGLTPAPPTAQQVEYYRADGSLALIVGNASQGKGGMEQEPRFKGENVKLANSIDAHELTFEPQITILWWNRDGGYSVVEGHGIPRAEMLKIAASMSGTAELGATQAPPVQPTPTQVPAPSFTVLHPAWLPEEMMVTETNVPTPNLHRSGVELRFDPHPDGTPHDMLTLNELPKSFAATNMNDAQQIQKEIGDKTVTVIMRGKGCVSYFWIQGDVAFTLTNPYDPPGEPGQVRYSCEQMEHVIASIQ